MTVVRMAGIRHRIDGATPGPGPRARAVCRLDLGAANGPQPMTKGTAEMSFSREHRNPQYVRRRIRRLRNGLLALCLAGIAVMLLAGPAAAAPTSNTQVVSV